jgi:hypothetical protein
MAITSRPPSRIASAQERPLGCYAALVQCRHRRRPRRLGTAQQFDHAFDPIA